MERTTLTRLFLGALVATTIAASATFASPSGASAALGSFEELVDTDVNPDTPAVREFAGATRYETSLAAAKRYFDTASAAGNPASTVIIASGESLIDAAAAAGLSRATNAPVLLTPPDQVFIPTAHLIETAGISRIIVVGGTAVVSEQVVTVLRNIAGVASVERIGGLNRFDTAAQIGVAMNSAEQYCDNGQRSALLVPGDSDLLTDVIVAGPMAYAMGLPILLTSTTEIPSDTLNALKTLDVEHVVVISSSVNPDAELIANGITDSTTISGDNPFATSVAVISAMQACLGDDFSTDTIALVSDTSLPDGISAAPILGQGLGGDNKATPALLVSSRALPAEAKNYLLDTDAAISITAIGGFSAVSNEVSRAAVAAANGNPSNNYFSDASDDPAECRLVGFNAGGHGYNGDLSHGDDGHTHDTLSVGFPLASWAAPTTGLVRVAVLYIDFPDAPASYSTFAEGAAQIAKAERYLEQASYGKIDVDFQQFDRWLRMPRSWRRYANSSVIGTQTLLPRDVVPTAISLATDEFDFSNNYDTVMIIAPSNYFAGGIASTLYDLVPEDPNQHLFTIINSQPYDRNQLMPVDWWDTAAHELGHNLGLVDYYPYDNQQFRAPTERPPSGKVWVTIDFGLMGLQGHLLVDQNDPRFHTRVTFPRGWSTVGSRSTATNLSPREMLSWSRWQLDWLDDNQVACLAEPEFEKMILLSPATSSTDTTMAMVALTDTLGVVLESRRRVGFDTETVRSVPCCEGEGERVTRIDSLTEEGVLIYIVDATRDGGYHPLELWFAGPNDPSILGEYPILETGETTSMTLSDGSRLEVAVEADDGYSYAVRIKRS